METAREHLKPVATNVAVSPVEYPWALAVVTSTSVGVLRVATMEVTEMELVVSMGVTWNWSSSKTAVTEKATIEIICV